MFKNSDKENSRIDALKELAILDTAQEVCYNDIVEMAASVCDVPMSLVTFVDAERQWFKASIGLNLITETPRETSFCSYAIQQDGIFEISDASQDSRFACNPLVTDSPNIRFYAGATLRLNNGEHVGALCVLDNLPKRLSINQRRILSLLSATVVQLLEGRRANAQYAASEARFRALSASSPLGIFSTTVDGSCTYTNERWQTIFGLNQADSLGPGWACTIHADDKDAVFSEWRRTSAAGVDFDMHFRIQQPNNGIAFVRAVSRPVFTADGEISGHVGSVEDVTVQKERQEVLRKSEALLAETGAMADIGGWELDLSTQKLYWTDHTFRIHELTPGNQPSLAASYLFYAPDSRPVIAEAISRAMTEGIGWDLELEMVTAKGTSIWVRSVGRLDSTQSNTLRLIGIIQNISQKVSQRHALADASERVMLATESGDIGVWDWDIHTNNVTWTPQMFSLYGLPTETSMKIYSPWSERVHPADKIEIERTNRNAIEGDALAFNSEFRVLWPDGSVHHIRAAARITRDGNGTAIQVLGVNWDVTPLRQLSGELARQHELLQVTLQSIGDAVITTDTNGGVTWLNPVAEDMTGWSARQAIGEPIASVFNIIHESTRKIAPDPTGHCMNQSQVVRLASNNVLISRSGAEFGVEDSAAPIRSRSGDLLGAVLVFHDVSEQRQLVNEIKHRAMHDTLTGLVNRSEFESRLHKTLKLVKNNGISHALLYVDLDQFKLVNDSCGHPQGDQLLIRVAKLMSSIVSSADTVARIGGDEFALILKDCNTDRARQTAQKICNAMSDFRFIHEKRRFRIGTSIGVVCLDHRWNTLEAVMQAADISCYAAKEEGRNRVHIWHDTQLALNKRKEITAWRERIEQALEDDRFELHAQLIQSVGSGSGSNCAEILIRMRDENNKLIYPNSFIVAAERFNLATRIDRWVLNKTIDVLHHLSDLKKVTTFFINLSGQSVGDRVFHADAIQLLTEAGIDICQRLCLEITETAAVTNILDAATFVNHVRTLGVRVALDDFGAGASSFGYLKTLKVDLLKIDGQFMEGVVNDPLDNAAVRCFVDVANVMGIKTVAEYVSTAAVLECVTNIGVDYAQGFHLHQPEPIEQVLNFWSEDELAILA